MLVYKFVELSTVTDESIELAVNECVREGWHFEGMHFAMAPASKRPAMAFLAFTRDEFKFDEPETTQGESETPTD